MSNTPKEPIAPRDCAEKRPPAPRPGKESPSGSAAPCERPAPNSTSLEREASPRKRRLSLGLSQNNAPRPATGGVFQAQEPIRQSLSHGRSKSVTVEVKRARTWQRPGTSSDAGSKLTSQEHEARMRAVREAAQRRESDGGESFSRLSQRAQIPQEVYDRAFHSAPASHAKISDVVADKAPEAVIAPEAPRPIAPSEPHSETRHSVSGTQNTFRGRPDQAQKPGVRASSSEGPRSNNGEPRDRSDATRQPLRSRPPEEPLFRASGGSMSAPSSGFRRADAGPSVGLKSPGGSSSSPVNKHKGATVSEERKRKSGPFRRTGPSETAPVRPGKDQKRFEPRDYLRSDTAEGEERRPAIGLKKLRKKGSRFEKKMSSSFLSAPKVVEIKERMMVKDLAIAMAEKKEKLVHICQKMSLSVTQETFLDGDTCQLIAQEMGFDTKRAQWDQDQKISWWNEAPITLEHRAPVVTVMGHVDHGKTSLLDALRKTDVVSTEAGGITQHLGAYQVTLPSKRCITFIDTPGHQAFTHMRARGARLTDIVILVVAADEGINEQTIEAIGHCQVANIPMIVAINKMDKPGANPDMVRQRLLQHSVVVEKMGGSVLDVEISALKGTNLDALEEAILLQADIMELSADPNMRAKGIVLETYVKKGHGPVASVLIQEGSLKKGDWCVVGSTWGRVRLLFDNYGRSVAQAGPSQPVEIVGLQNLPASGDTLLQAPSEAEAKEYLERKAQNTLLKEEAPLEEDLSPMSFQVSTVKEKLMILKADAQGSLEGLDHELSAITHEEVGVRTIYKGIGPVNEGDVLLAQTAKAMIVAFNVQVLPEARRLLEQSGVLLLSHRIIYRVSEEVRAILTGLLAPAYEEEFLGKAEVIQIFSVKKGADIAGCLIKEGVMRRGCEARVLRKGKEIAKGTLKSLRHMKDDVKEKGAGSQCGIVLEGFQDFILGDVIEAFVRNQVQRHV